MIGRPSPSPRGRDRTELAFINRRKPAAMRRFQSSLIAVVVIDEENQFRGHGTDGITPERTLDLCKHTIVVAAHYLAYHKAQGKGTYSMLCMVSNVAMWYILPRSERGGSKRK